MPLEEDSLNHISNCCTMKSRVALVFLIFTQALASSRFGEAMKDLAKRADHDHGKRRLKKEFCEEFDRHWMGEDSKREIEKLRRLSDDFALKILSDILDRMDKRFKGEADTFIRHLMKKLKLPDPPVYRLLEGRYTADAAEKRCNDLGGKLAIIRSGTDQSLALETVSRASSTKVFIGLIRNGRDISWRDGSKMTYYTFRSGFRGRYKNKYSRYCGVIERSDGTWSFTSCNVRLPALCQFKVNSTPRPPPPQKYKLLKGYFESAHTATKACKGLGGRLAIIRSGTDQSLAWQASRRASTSRIFIGLIADRRGFTWRDGSKMTYKNFRKGYIPPYRGYTRCGVIERKTGTWVVISCYSRIEALCQFPVNSTSRPSIPDKETGKTPSGTTPSRGISPPRGATPKPRRYLETDLRFMFEYEMARRDQRFKADLITAIGKLLQKNNSDISVLGMRPGSTIVRLRVYLTDQENAERIIAVLQREAKLGGVLDMKFYGRLRPIIDPFPEPYKDDSYLKIVIPIVVLVVVMIIVLLAVVCCMMKKRRNVRPVIDTTTVIPVPVVPEALPTYKEFTANDYTKPPGEPNAPPAYDYVEKPVIA